MEVSEDFDNYHALPLKFEESSANIHYAFFTEMASMTSQSGSSRRILVVNIPSFSTEDSIKMIFSEFGHVKSCNFVKLKGFKQALVTFKSVADCKKALGTVFHSPRILSTSERPILVGYAKYCASYSDNKELNLGDIQAEADKYMQGYDKRNSEKSKSKSDEPDDEGWVTVTRQGKKRGVARSDTNQRRAAEREKRKRQAKELVGFYRFQLRDRKRQDIENLKRKFEDDKKRVAEMKAKRKFRPY